MKMAARKKISIEIVEQRIRDAHGDVVKIKHDTYDGVAKKATFIDESFGEWTAFVTNVFLGHGHPLRGKQRSQETNLKKYGSISPLGNPEIRQMMKDTNLERYGVENPFCKGKVRDKFMQEFLEKHGVENPQQVKEIRERTLATNVERYGAEHPYQSPELLERAKQTCRDRYGVENPMQLEETRAKSRATCLERYGVENPAQDPEIYKKGLRKKRRFTEIEHWKTGEMLNCVGSYEAAFVKFFNDNKVDFDWQIAFAIPTAEAIHPDIRGKVYNIDAYVKSGEFAGNYVEIKGIWMQEVSRLKWEWFQSCHSNALLWTKDELKAIGILAAKSSRSLKKEVA